MQMLFQWDMSRQDCVKLEAKFWKSAKAADSTRVFANRLLEGATQELATLDELITRKADNWKFERLSAIDRAILRLALHEIAVGKTPARTVINEAVKLAKKYSSDDSAAFVNGILDAAVKARPKNSAHRTPHNKAKTATDSQPS